MQTFTPAELTTLQSLLEKVAANGGFWPDEETMRIAHSAISYWACELVVSKIGLNGLEILLAKYNGGVKEFLGMWHIPGGYNRTEEPDIQTTCSRIAKREIGSEAIYRHTLDAYKWAPGEHPYGRPLSLYVECEPVAAIQETDALKFFPISALPDNMVPAHQRFIVSLR
jgi:ADP-ribose pyrophosphatase YjhB (NUDIX family)